MENKTYDIIILWAWPAWLFCASKIAKNFSVLLLDKAGTPAQKLLLSAKWRWNITNIKINPQNDYASDDSEFVVNAFKKYWTKDFLDFLDEHKIRVKEENNWRILLDSGKVSQFHEKLIQLVKDKWVNIKFGLEIQSIVKNGDIFEIKASDWIYKSKIFIVATWWPSFPKLGATDIATDIAKTFNLTYVNYFPALVWFITNQDFSSLSWSSVIGCLNLLKWNKIIYKEVWPILFTHQWISGPCVFNASLFMRDHNSKYKIKININSEDITKRLLSFLWFHKNILKEYRITTDIINIGWLDEAKVCWWWVGTTNLNESFECKNMPWLYFIWECLDVTGKTWWFNLQRCWTSWSICAESINEKK